LAPKGPLLAVLLAFGLSRAGYYAAGVRFDASTLGTYWQHIDVPLLRHHLLESLWYLHSQPPLYNLFLGVVVKLWGNNPGGAFSVIFLAVGLVLSTGLLSLCQNLGISPWLSAGLTILFVASPPAILYEHWLYVEYFVVTCLVWAGVFLHRFASSGRLRDAFVFFSLAAVVVLSRSLFHPLWLLGLVVLLCLVERRHTRVILAAAALPLVLVVGFSAKNLFLFGSLSATSCTGMNAARVVTDWVPRAERTALIHQGKLSKLAVQDPYGLPRTMPELFRRERPRGVALLDQPTKASGAPNADHTAYIDICSRYFADARTLLRLHPDAFRQGVQNGVLTYWRPSSQYFNFSQHNLDSTKSIDRIFSAIVFGQFRRDEVFHDRSNPIAAGSRFWHQLGLVAWFVVAVYAAAILFAITLAWRAVRHHEWSPLATFALFVLATSLWVTLVGTLFEEGENNRFRFLLDPLLLSLFAVLASRLVLRFRGRSSDRSTGQTRR